MPQIDIPDRPFSGYLFDCDGTLVNSMPLHYVAWCAGFEAAGAPYPFTEEDFYGNAGIKEEVIVGALNRRHEAEVDPDHVVSAKAEVFEGLFAELETIRPVVDFARSLPAGTKIAVVSGSTEPHVRRCLETVGILDLFPTIVTPADVAPGRGKPHPDMFLLAAEQIAAPPADCLVFEDGQSGIEAAAAAGMASAFVPRFPLGGS